MSRNWIHALAAAALMSALLVATQVSAAPIGAPAPIAGYDTNSGVERFDADGLVFAVELMDSPGGGFGEFGIYYDEDTRITLFGADDMGAGQSAMVDLVGGSVMDVDASTFDFFDPHAGDFGFYFKKSHLIIYSEARLNVHNTTPTSIGTYAARDSADQYLITLEWWDEDLAQTLAIEAVGGIRPAEHPASAVPEPNAAMLFGAGALLLGGAVRRGRR